MKKLWHVLVGIVALIYLLNPSAGFFELIPDNFPIIGNLDEVGAAIVLLAVLRSFGFDLTGFFKRRVGPSSKDPKNKNR